MKEQKAIAVIDYETDPFKYGRIPKAFACGFYDGTTYSQIFSNDEDKVLRWARKNVSRFDGIVYAHNGGKFDFVGFLFRGAGSLLEGETCEMRGNRIVRVRFGKAELRDSFAILPAPLKAHDKGEIDYKLFEKGKREKHREKILEYLKRDCYSLFRLVAAFIEVHGTRPLTAAAAGMAWLKGESGYEVQSLSSQQDEKFREWYFGGRVEAFRPGIFRGRFKVYDIKSAYPFAMCHRHSTGDVFEFLGGRTRIRNTDMVCVQASSSGCFPKREKEKLTYPHAKGIWHVTGWEYLTAKALKLIKGKILYVERPTQTTDFKRYVDHWFEQKEASEKKGDASGRLIAKIMLNAPTGKFAQNPEKYREYLFVPVGSVLSRDDESRGFREEVVDEVNGYSIWSLPTSRPPFFYNVTTAASITGFVRAMLMRVIFTEKPYYCDTDSIIVDHPVSRGVLGTGGLGSWGLETEGDLLYVAGKKLYALRVLTRLAGNKASAKAKGYFWDGNRAWKIASKGCRMTPQEMKVVALGGSVQTYNQAPTYSIKTGTRFITRKIRKI